MFDLGNKSRKNNKKELIYVLFSGCMPLRVKYVLQECGGKRGLGASWGLAMRGACSLVEVLGVEAGDGLFVLGCRVAEGWRAIG